MAPLKFSFCRSRSREQEAEQLQQTVMVDHLQQIHGENVQLLDADNLQQFNAEPLQRNGEPLQRNGEPLQRNGEPLQRNGESFQRNVDVDAGSQKTGSPLPSTSQFSFTGSSVQMDSESIDIPYADDFDYQNFHRSTSTNLNTIEETPTHQMDILCNRSKEYLKFAQRHRSMESITPSTSLLIEEENTVNGSRKKSLVRRSTLPLIKPSTYNLLLMRQNIAQSHLDALLQKHDATVKCGYSMSSSGANLIDDNISSNYSDDCSIVINCGSNKSRSLKKLSDRDMWSASNYVVMKNLLERRGSVEDRIKWEAIAASRGLCTLRTNCGCIDCRILKIECSSESDGDGGLGVAPLFLNSCSVM